MRHLCHLLILSALASSASAQAGNGPQPGDRVWVRSVNRLGAPLDRGVKGWYDGADENGVRIRISPRGPVEAIPVTPETWLFIYAGRKNAIGRGALIGAGLGAGVGAVIGLAGGGDCSGSDYICFDRGSMALAGAAAVGGVGLAAGLIIGALTTREVWSQSALPGSARPQVSSVDGRIRLGFSMTW